MLPAQLTSNSFATYPPSARKFASEHVDLLRTLPAAFLPFLLKEIIAYDWQFPAESEELDRQLAYLAALPLKAREQEMKEFESLQLTRQLTESDWVKEPARFVEQVSAHLWATGQMTKFRATSEEYIRHFHATLHVEPLPLNRLGVAVIGRGSQETSYVLFRKLRRQGVYYRNLNPQGGWQQILRIAAVRAEAQPVSYGHWYIDGGPSDQTASNLLTRVSYDQLTPVRTVLANKMRVAYESPNFQAEALRTMLAQMSPSDLGMRRSTDPRLDRFQVSVLTEGSGTQVFSTTFVQWTAREVYRRAQPLTTVMRFAPRVKERSMAELLARVEGKNEVDLEGSLIDADMGAYYCWLNQQKLRGFENGSFLAWFEGTREAVAIGPKLPSGKEDTQNLSLDELLRQLTTS